LAFGLFVACDPGADDPMDEVAAVVSDEDIPTHDEVAIVHHAATRADVVFVGEVVDVEYVVSQPDANALSLPFTIVTWRVEDAVKGVTDEATYAARFLGGPIGEKWMKVTEIPEFEIGDRDLLFLRADATVGCPLVDGARGRVRLLQEDETADGLSPVASGEGWVRNATRTIHEAGLAGGAVVAQTDLRAPFTFAWPKSATHDEMRAAGLRARARLDEAAVERVQSPEEAAERAAYEANGRNPVLPR
jgi:hypothetical protein